MIGPPPAAAKWLPQIYINAIIKILIAGKAAIIRRMATPAIPTVFFNSTEALITVSVASVNILPMTGMKFPVINFAVRMVIPSVTAAEAP